MVQTTVLTIPGWSAIAVISGSSTASVLYGVSQHLELGDPSMMRYAPVELSKRSLRGGIRANALDADLACSRAYKDNLSLCLTQLRQRELEELHNGEEVDLEDAAVTV